MHSCVLGMCMDLPILIILHELVSTIIFFAKMIVLAFSEEFSPIQALFFFFKDHDFNPQMVEGMGGGHKKKRSRNWVFKAPLNSYVLHFLVNFCKSTHPETDTENYIL